MTNKKLGTLLISVAIVIALTALQEFAPETQPEWPAGITPETINYDEFHLVERVVDGDTIVLANGGTVRYVGIDTPETHDPRKAVQCFGEEAVAANRALVEGKRVKVVRDVSERDKYGRFLGYIYLEDGTFVNAELVQRGFAFAYKYQPDIAHYTELKNFERAAQSQGQGLWSACTVRKLSGGRMQTNDI